MRGLDYYMRTTFEITAPGLGSQNAVCGGGRYDGLVELLGGAGDTKGIGFCDRHRPADAFFARGGHDLEETLLAGSKCFWRGLARRRILPPWR